MKFRKLLRSLHRDFGYLITGMMLIYGISGIALNHRKDWNADYIAVNEVIDWGRVDVLSFEKESIMDKLNLFDQIPVFKKHYIADDGKLKVFVENGMVTYNPETGLAEMEVLKKRPVFYQINKLHKTAITPVWIWVSDLLAVIMIFVAVSGLFLLKGKYGLKGRGWWLTLLGFAIPGIFLIFFIT